MRLVGGWRVTIGAAAVALVTVTVGATAQQDAPAPDPRLPLGAAFDAARGEIVAVGGFADGVPDAQTWLWQAGAWRRHDGPGPSARDEPAMVYDAARKRVVLFGGDTGMTAPGSLHDTWEWDGSAWKLVSINGPPARAGAGMVFDAKRKRVVLFSGYSGPGRPELTDVWEWDGNVWTERVSDTSRLHPPGRLLFGMAYDEAREVTVVFGGLTLAGAEPLQFADTWEWNGTAWHRHAVAGPDARDHVTMTYSPAHRGVILHGGGSPAGLKADTWLWNGSAWTRLVEAGPPRAKHRLGFDPRGGRVLMIGGFAGAGRTNEIWELRGAEWSRTAAR